MKNIKFLGVVTALAFALPMAASASTNIQNLTFDGAANVTGNTSDSVPARLSVNLTGDSDIESVGYDYTGDGLDRVCVNVKDQLQTGYRVFDLKDLNGNDGFTLPANTGNWDVVVTTFGIDGAGANQDCQGSPTDSMPFNDRITVIDGGDVNPTDGSGGNNGTGGSSEELTLLQKLIAQASCVLGGNVWNGSSCTPHATTTPPVPTTSSVCGQLAQALVGTQDNVYNSANIALQGFLLFQKQSIPALAAGASFGYKGPQTNAALASFKMQNSCI